MKLSLDLVSPIYLLILIPIFAAVISFGLRKRYLPLFHRICGIIMRGIICLLLVLSICGMTITEEISTTTTIFAFDLSDSVGGNDEAQSFALEAQGYMAEYDMVGAVSFGGNAVIESMPSEDSRITEINSYVEQDYTDIESALNLAGTLLPQESKKRVVLISDGIENSGNAANAAAGLLQSGAVIDTYIVGNVISEEAQISSLSVPDYINKDTEYTITVNVYSLTANNATLNIYKNGNKIASSEVSLQAGDNRFTYRDTASKGGGISFRAEIVPAVDTYSENNAAYAYSYVTDVPKILVIEYNNSGAELVKLIESSAAEAVVVSAAAAPETAEALAEYNAVVLADVALSDLPSDFDNTLSNYVKNLGGGVFVSGGGNSYALGGYYETAMEELLPVDMTIKDEEKMPNLGMIILLDRSGSMSGSAPSKLDIAKEAVIRAVDGLSAGDSFGVLAFDDGNEWPVPYAQVGNNADSIKNRVASITDGGGTSILPALEEAVEVLKESDVKLKHIILLTDGQAETSGYDPVIMDLLANDMTLSCVAVGSDADTKLLAELAALGGGRYYYSDNYTDLPQIFAQETDLAGRSHVNNYVFTPVINSSSDILSGIDTVPDLAGYISTTAKARADVILTSDTEEPILATWQYGLGRAASWTSNVDGGWAGEFLASDDGVEILKNTISWVMRAQLDSNVTIDVSTSGTSSELTIYTPYSDGITAVDGVLIDQNNNELDLAFTVSEPGVFTAAVEKLETGSYVAGLVLTNVDGAENVVLGVSVPYSEEYNIKNVQNGSELLGNLAEMSGGRVLTSPEEVFVPIEAAATGSSDISGYLLLAALLLLVADIFLRRFSFVESKLQGVLARKKKTRDKKLKQKKIKE